MTHPPIKQDVNASQYLFLLVVFLVTVPGLYFGISHAPITPVMGTILFGIAIFGAAFLLSWATEAAQIDISQSFAIAILALVAVLPEYAVDFVFTWKAAHDPEQAHYAIANMTGANRLLVGMGWPVVVLLFVLAKKKKAVILEKSQRVEIFYLGMATLYSFTIPLKGNLNLIDTVILVTLFALYARRAAKMEVTEPELVGPVKILANMKDGSRRASTVLLFFYSGLVIFLVAEPFAESLVTSATVFGIDEFHAVQWLAPLASEAPEFIVACTWALRGAAGAAIRVLISSKVNQWTLLVGTIPLVYAISGGAIHPFPLDVLQCNELILTAAQSLFGLAVLVDLRFDTRNALMLAFLFLLQLFWPDIRVEVAAVYIVLAVVFLVLHRRYLVPAARAGLDIGNK
jgi:cation:H+ antiporter